MFALKLQQKSKTNRSKTVSSELVKSRLADPRGICAFMEDDLAYRNALYILVAVVCACYREGS